MTLEDHAGDIIRKARKAAGVSAEAAAHAASLSLREFEALEDRGQFDKPLNFSALGSKIGLDGAKLDRVARGWLPQPVDLARWPALRPITTTRRYAVHCYLSWDPATRQAALFDTGWEAEPIFKIIQDHSLLLEHLFITHTHDDHVAALGSIRARFPQVRLHSSSKHAPAAQRNQPGQITELGALRITSRETPGHAEDGVTYVLTGFPGNPPAVAIVGDCIFAGSIGRGFISTDLLKEKVRAEILSLPDSTLLCPGHGPLTTVREEREANPFF